MDDLFYSNISTIVQHNVHKDVLSFTINCSKTCVLICFDTLKILHVTIDSNEYYLRTPGTYSILHNSDGSIIHIKIHRINENPIDLTVLSYIKVYEFGNPLKLSDKKYQIMYAFDKNYYVGAFASICSLIQNFDKSRLNNLNINICIVKEDLDSFLKIVNNTRLEINLILYVVDSSIIDSRILQTACFKGGNHLMKISNFNRLICGHIIQCDNLLYLDSDTIIKSDVSKILDKIPNEEYTILGKSSNLRLCNLLNANNIEYAKDYIGNNSEKPIIYTGTIIINPRNFRARYNDMIKLISLHNNLFTKGGLYKLFTMSIINITLIDDIKYFDSFLDNLVDLGCKKDIDETSLKTADVLDWSGVLKPWFKNGLYKKYWKKYDILNYSFGECTTNKNTIERFT